MANQIIPAAGQRIGSVCGPGQYPKDNAGIVITQITDRWGTHAMVLMDTGAIEYCNGLKQGPGIGWHAIN